MWSDETDLTQLSQRLRVGPRELIDAIGGPWHVSRRDEDDEAGRAGTLFVGRAGPCVGILVDDDTDPLVRIGPAEGRWREPGALDWSIVEPVSAVPTPEVDAPSAVVDRFVERLGSLVDSVAADRAARLVTCRYCGSLVAPELTVGEELCQGCGASIFGIDFSDPSPV